MKPRTVNICYLYLALLVAAVVLTPFFSFQANACTCSNPPIREALALADAVFIGKAIEGDEEKEETISNGKTIVRLSGRVRFSVEWAFSGVKRSDVIVETGNSAGCFVDDFAQGDRYLLYAQGSEDQVFIVGLCSRSTDISGADEDLKILSSLSPKTCGVKLYGTAISGTKITATDDQGQTLEAVSEAGRYEIDGVKPNVEYTVQAHFPDYFQKGNANLQKVRINTCGWANVGFYPIYDGSIRGRVIDTDGKPVSNAVVELTPSSLTGFLSDGAAISDWHGRFELTGVAPGAYLLGINITREPEKNHPYPPIWYQNESDRESATIIELGPGQKLSGYDLVIPRRLAERIIEGTVFWPDGRPAAKADVYLYTSKQQESVWLKAIYTDGQGRFKVTGYEGIAYYVVARSAPNRDEPPVWKWFFAEPPLVELKGENVTGLKLTLTWDEETFKDFFEKKRERQK